MAVRPGDVVTARFVTTSPTTGAAADADSLPTGILVRNGTNTAETVTITDATGTGRYNAAFTVPASWSAGDDLTLDVTATVASVTLGGTPWFATLDLGYTSADSDATSISSSTSYAAASDCLAWIDERDLRDLVEDADERVNQATLLASTYLATHLLAASGEVEAYVLRGGRYSPTDLGVLAGVGLAFLKRLVVVRALVTMARRRRWVQEQLDALGDEWSMRILEDLGQGKLVFGLLATVEASGTRATTLVPTDPTTPNFTQGRHGRAWGTGDDEIRTWR